MSRGERIDKDVEALTWERDVGSTDGVLWAKDISGFKTSGPNSSMKSTNCSTREKDISQEVYRDFEEEISSEQGGGTHPVPLEKGDTQHETQEINDHLGDTAKVQGAVVDRGGPLNLNKLIERFNDLKLQELKPRTRLTYTYVFKGFAKYINLEKKRKRDLRQRGRKYILDYLRTKVPKKSWKRVRAGLQTFWEDILELDFPLRRSDIKRFPKTGRCYTPPDNVVLEWAEALTHERDPYLRLIWLLIAQHGWRPGHVGGIRWRHIQRDKDGEPVSIFAEPKNGEFKTEQPVAAHLSPDVREAIKSWEREVGNVDLGNFVIPWRSRAEGGRIDWNRPFDNFQCLRIFKDLRRRHRLPKLTPRDFRHWVSTACRKAGLSKAATAYLQGHDSSGGSSMRDWYDNITPPEAIVEQAEVISNGPLGTLLQPEIKVEGDIPIEAKDLFSRYLSGDLGSIELMTELEELKRRMKDADILKP